MFHVCCATFHVACGPCGPRPDRHYVQLMLIITTTPILRVLPSASLIVLFVPAWLPCPRQRHPTCAKLLQLDRPVNCVCHLEFWVQMQGHGLPKIQGWFFCGGMVLLPHMPKSGPLPVAPVVQTLPFELVIQQTSGVGAEKLGALRAMVRHGCCGCIQIQNMTSGGGHQAPRVGPLALTLEQIHKPAPRACGHTLDVTSVAAQNPRVGPQPRHVHRGH
jgi:hypothetical protein